MSNLVRRNKYISSILLFLSVVLNSNAQSIAFSYKGDWSSWIPICSPDRYWITSSWGENSLKISRYTNMSGIVLRSQGGREILSFQITNFTLPDKKSRKEHLKTGQWFSFYGTVDYYVNDDYPTAEDLAKHCRLVIPNPRTDQSPSVKRHTVCEIRIAPFKKEPECWNIFFDGIGIGIDTQGLTFKK